MILKSLCANWKFRRPSYLPPCWSSFTHPEGQAYFYRHSHPRIVTEAHLYRSEVMAAILGFAKHIEELILERNIVLEDSIELLLQIDEADLQSCEYYFVDHATRAVFWLEEVSTEDFGISPAISTSHLSTSCFPLCEKDIYFLARIRS
jgi:hypothetical protein